MERYKLAAAIKRGEIQVSGKDRHVRWQERVLGVNHVIWLSKKYDRALRRHCNKRWYGD